MKKILLIILLGYIVTSFGRAQMMERYSITVLGEYGYNHTYTHFGGADIKGYLPINEHFEIEPGIQLLSNNSYSGALNTRALFPLPVGKLYVENRLIYKAVVRDNLYDFNAALGLGYKMDYVNIEFGMFGHFIDSFKHDYHTDNEILAEPFNLLYRLEVNVRPETSNWNLNACVSNFDDFQMERMWSPLFMLGGLYKPTDELSILAQVECKPTGMFHLNASFYGINARIGIKYEFNRKK